MIWLFFACMRRRILSLGSLSWADPFPLEVEARQVPLWRQPFRVWLQLGADELVINPVSVVGMEEQFICEAIALVASTGRLSDALRGEPALPMRFRWRDRDYDVKEVIEKWKTTGPCHHGSSENYVRKHWFRIRTTDGPEMTLYCDRQPRRGQSSKRWWLYTVKACSTP